MNSNVDTSYNSYDYVKMQAWHNSYVTSLEDIYLDIISVVLEPCHPLQAYP